MTKPFYYMIFYFKTRVEFLLGLHYIENNYIAMFSFAVTYYNVKNYKFTSLAWLEKVNFSEFERKSRTTVLSNLVSHFSRVLILHSGFQCTDCWKGRSVSSTDELFWLFPSVGVRTFQGSQLNCNPWFVLSNKEDIKQQKCTQEDLCRKLRTAERDNILFHIYFVLYKLLFSLPSKAVQYTVLIYMISF